MDYERSAGGPRFCRARLNEVFRNALACARAAACAVSCANSVWPGGAPVTFACAGAAPPLGYAGHCPWMRAPAAACSSLAQWCAPPRRQHAGNLDSGSAVSGTIGDKPNSASSKMAGNRRTAASYRGRERRVKGSPAAIRQCQSLKPAPVGGSAGVSRVSTGAARSPGDLGKPRQW